MAHDCIWATRGGGAGGGGMIADAKLDVGAWATEMEFEMEQSKKMMKSKGICVVTCPKAVTLATRLLLTRLTNSNLMWRKNMCLAAENGHKCCLQDYPRLLMDHESLGRIGLVLCKFDNKTPKHDMKYQIRTKENIDLSLKTFFFWLLPFYT